MDGEISCTLKGEAQAGASSEEICALFVEAMKEAGQADVERIALTALSETRAKAVALDHSGNTLADLDYAIMDRELALDSWNNLARSLLRELQR